MSSPNQPWRSYLLDSHGVSRVQRHPVRLDPCMLPQGLVRVPLIPYNGRSTPKSADSAKVAREEEGRNQTLKQTEEVAADS